uniref:Uncharacterized protein n=1 Tax=Urocitellus parryii TaxID=9999 RepID=A0A8D2H2L9_UROPR
MVCICIRSGISNVCNVLWGFLILLICRRFALVQMSRHLNSSHSFATKEPPHLGHVSHCPIYKGCIYHKRTRSHSRLQILNSGNKESYAIAR